MSLLEKLNSDRQTGKKNFAVLLDPDNADTSSTKALLEIAQSSRIDYFFVGGSLITNHSLGRLLSYIKEESNIPAIIFPGSNLHIHPSADGILLLSLISGRNPEFLIGQHVVAAPLLKSSGLEIMSTGYILVDCGKQTTVSYISNTTPIPSDKPSIAACTAMAGELLGLKLIYLDGGSGASHPVPAEVISKVRSSIDLPLIVGGGINSKEKAFAALKAGADLIVIGNAIEENPELLTEISEVVLEYNEKLKVS